MDAPPAVATTPPENLLTNCCKPKFILGIPVFQVPQPTAGIRAALVILDQMLERTQVGITDETLAYLARTWGFIPPRCEPDRSGLSLLRKVYSFSFEDLYLGAQRELMRKILNTFTYHNKCVPPIYKHTSIARTLSPGSVRALVDLCTQLRAQPASNNLSLVDGAIAGAHLTLKLDLKGQSLNNFNERLVQRGVRNAPATMLDPSCLDLIYTAARGYLECLTVRNREIESELRRVQQLVRIAVEVMQLQTFDPDGNDDTAYGTVSTTAKFDQYDWTDQQDLITACRQFSALDPETVMVIDDLLYPIKPFDKPAMVIEQYNPTIRLLLAKYVVLTCHEAYLSNRTA